MTVELPKNFEYLIDIDLNERVIRGALYDTRSDINSVHNVTVIIATSATVQYFPHGLCKKWRYARAVYHLKQQVLANYTVAIPYLYRQKNWSLTGKDIER